MDTRRWLLLSAILAVSTVVADERTHPFVAASYVTTPESSFGFPENEVEGREYRLALGLLAVDAEGIGLDLGIDYQYTRYEYTGIDGRNRDLHRLQLPVGFELDMGEWQFDGFAAPGISTSSNVMKDLFDKASSDDFILTARLEGMRPARANLFWLAGLAYDRAFGEPVPYPLIGVVYQPRDSVQVRLAFPDPELRYTPSERQRWTVRLFPAGHEWHVFSEELNDEFDYEVEAWRAQLTWSLNFTGRFYFDLSAGYEFERHHSFVDDLGRLISADIDDEVFVAVGLRFGNAPIPYAHDIVR